MNPGISAVAVRLMLVVDAGERRVVAEPKGEARTDFYRNGFFQVASGENCGRLFYLSESGDEIWGDDPEQALAAVNAHVRSQHH
jgi:hypothetical protein